MTKEEEYIKKNNLDEIDSFLFREFGIMGGACSAQKAFEYHTARMVAEKLWKKEEPTGADFDTEWENYFKYKGDMATVNIKDLARHFVNWQKSHLWKDAQGDDLPEIDREVVALQGRKVVFAHRPPEYWDGKNIDTGEVTRYYPQTYDKGGWNMPDVKYWLDVELPEGIDTLTL